MNIKEYLLNTIFVFGSTDFFSVYGYMSFSDDGKILSYNNDNERFYKLDGDTVCIYNKNYDMTRIFDRNAEAFIGKDVNSKSGFFLVPLIKFSHAPDVSKFTHRLFVNSIPKSGTYFLERIMMNLGYTSARLHIGGRNVCDDYRFVDDSEIHVEPQLVRRIFPLNIIDPHVKQGEFLVGHVEYKDIVDKFKEDGFSVISMKRNLRDVLISLYNFKLHKVHSLGLGDDLWKSLSDDDRFIGFLSYYENIDIAHIKLMASLIADDESALRYEDLNTGSVFAASYISKELGVDIEIVKKTIDGARGQHTPTKSMEHATYFWDNRAEDFFIRSQLFNLNKKLGYE